jgi:hypothetical protein
MGPFPKSASSTLTVNSLGRKITPLTPQSQKLTHPGNFATVETSSQCKIYATSAYIKPRIGPFEPRHVQSNLLV